MQFRDPGLRFHTERSRHVRANNWTIRGEYRPYDDEEGLPSIHITLVYPVRERWCYIDKSDWDDIGFYIADIVTHEYIHQYHCRRRGFRYGRGYRQKSLGDYSENMQDYLGCEDEIVAHAFNIATEAVVHGRTIERTSIYRLYRRHFRHDPGIMLKLSRHALKYIREYNNEQTNPKPRKNGRGFL
jgi:hypothetical protein